MLAERLHLSGILTVVVFAMVTSRRAGTIPARIRIPSYAVWEFAVFVLRTWLAFILVGFQLKGILGRIDARTLLEYAGVAFAVCIATIAARIAWGVGSRGVQPLALSSGARWHTGTLRSCRPVGGEPRPWSGGVGMRGIVTLAPRWRYLRLGADGNCVSLS
jgi:CPA1 family monovalent cation:H+ antiporter